MIADDKPSAALADRATRETSLYPAWADAPMETLSEPVHDTAALQDLRDLTDPDGTPGHQPDGLYLPLPYGHTTGSQLRHRYVTPESIAELAQTEKRSLLQRLLGRK